MIVLYTLLAVLAGSCFAVQGPVNTGLGRKTSTFMATLISFTGGMLILAVLTALLGTGDLRQIVNMSFWKWLGGFYGAVNVCIAVTVMPVLGVALSLTANMLGQLIASLIIDSFGLLETEAIPVSPLRIAGILVVAGGILLIYAGNAKQNAGSAAAGAKDAKSLPLLFLMFASGFLGAVQTPTNRALSAGIGTLESTFVSFCIGFLSILIVVLVTGKGKIPSVRGKGVKPWQLLGGLLGAGGIYLNIVTMAHLGAALQTISAMIGQLACGLIVDSTGALESRKVSVNSRRICGVAVIAVGVVLVALAKAA